MLDPLSNDVALVATAATFGNSPQGFPGFISISVTERSGLLGP